MPTPHIEAKKSEIAKIVLMPGDPLRAKKFATTYLKNIKQVNNVRGMLAFTGTIHNKEVTVMGHGMGVSSMGIYAYELYKFYNVETIIRFGSCGAYTLDINLFDIIIAKKSYDDAGYGVAFGTDGPYSSATPELVELAKEAAASLKLKKQVITTTVHCSQWFYKETNIVTKKDMQDFVNKGILAIEMEGTALYTIANFFNKKALVILTSSDIEVNRNEITSEQRQNGFVDMFNILTKMMEKL